MPYPDTVGISFPEAMRGQLEKTGGGKLPFAFQLDLRITSLNKFRDAKAHLATVVGGSITWNGVAHPVTGGFVHMFDKAGTDKRVFDFQVTWNTPAGETRMEAIKTLHDDHGLDVFADLSHVKATITRAGKVLASGRLSVAIGDLIAQLTGMTVTGTTVAAVKAEAKHDFFAFMNDQLQQVYPSMPTLFDDGSSFSARQRQVLMMLAYALLPEDQHPGPTPREVIAGLERFVKNAVDTEKWPDATARSVERLLESLAPLIEKSGSKKEWREHVQTTLATGKPRVMADALSLLQKVFLLPYYGHKDGHTRVGYLPLPDPLPTHTPHGLKVTRTLPKAPNGGWDAVIVGAGVAGGILADRLTALGMDILILEAGPFIPQGSLHGDEVDGISKLYQEAGMQVANVDGGTNGQLLVLQGACVGGGAMVNNAVCFQLPMAKRAEWQKSGVPKAIIDALPAAYATIATELGIRPLSQSLAVGAQLNPAWKYLHGLGNPQTPKASGPPTAGFFEALVNRTGTNEPGCVGCGLCNNGCGYVRKSSVLKVHLPRACATGRATIVERAKVVDMDLFFGIGPRKLERLQVRLADGTTHDVRANKFILAAGAIGSSRILLNSGDLRTLLDTQGVPVGKRLGGNLGGFVHGFYPKAVRTGAHAQITHYLYDPQKPYIIESWFNPPGEQAQAFPGVGPLHDARMLRYQQALSLGVLVGAECKGTVHADGRISFPVAKSTFEAVRDGLAEASQLLLDGTTAGTPDEVVPATRDGKFVLKPGENANARFKAVITEPAQLALGTGHPQGGNALSTKDATGVVGGDFRLRGVENVFIADSSIFPTSAGVNPQWTVMALAHLAAVEIAK